MDLKNLQFRTKVRNRMRSRHCSIDGNFLKHAHKTAAHICQEHIHAKRCMVNTWLGDGEEQRQKEKGNTKK